VTSFEDAEVTLQRIVDPFPGAIFAPAPEVVIDDAQGGTSLGTNRHAQPVHKTYKIALTISRDVRHRLL
jgi:hypothetical protein